MKHYDVKLTVTAASDLLDIYDYIAFELLEPETAANLAGKLEEAIQTLEELPLRFEVITERPYTRMGVHRLYVDNYTAFYVVDEDARIVTVLRIAYGRRRWQSLFRD